MANTLVLVLSSYLTYFAHDSPLSQMILFHQKFPHAQQIFNKSSQNRRHRLHHPDCIGATKFHPSSTVNGKVSLFAILFICQLTKTALRVCQRKKMTYPNKLTLVIMELTLCTLVRLMEEKKLNTIVLVQYRHLRNLRRRTIFSL